VETSVFQPWDLFLLRAPLRAVTDDSLTAGVAFRTREDHLQLLRNALQQPVLLEALQLASPTLHAQLQKVAEGRSEEIKSAQVRRAALSVLR
jgi:lantibiotic biosynthesis protein